LLNRPSTVIQGRGLAKSSYSFYNSLFYSIYGICGGRGLVENVIWGRRGWLKTSEYRHIRVRGINCSKNRDRIFERFPQAALPSGDIECQVGRAGRIKF